MVRERQSSLIVVSQKVFNRNGIVVVKKNPQTMRKWTLRVAMGTGAKLISDVLILEKYGRYIRTATIMTIAIINKTLADKYCKCHLFRLYAFTDRMTATIAKYIGKSHIFINAKLPSRNPSVKRYRHWCRDIFFHSKDGN